MVAKKNIPQSAEPRITDPTIVEFHKTFKQLVGHAMRFFGGYQPALVLFNFTTTPTHYQLRIKFVSTHKMIKVLVPKTGFPNMFTYQQFVKTRNIVRDIDQIYIPQIPRVGDYLRIPEIVENLFVWGIQNRIPAIERKNNYFKAVPVPLTSVGNGESMEYNKLYYGFITYLQIEPQPNGNATVRLMLDDKEPFEIQDVSPDRLEIFRVHRVYIQNSSGKFNVMGLKSARHHLLFSDEQFAAIEAMAKNCEDSVVDDEFY